MKKEKLNEDSKIFALLSIIGFVVAILTWKEDKYVMFYAKQSLVIFLASFVIWVIKPLLYLIPILGKAIYVVLVIIIVLCWLMSWIYALSGKKEYAWFLGRWSKGIKI